MDQTRIKDLIFNDPEFYALNFLKIREYDSNRLVSLKFNETQRIVYNRILEAKKKKKPVRHLILKARKTGISTLYGAIGYHMSATRQLTDGMVAAHDTDTAILLFDKLRLYYDKSPSVVQPMRKARSRRELRFENPTQNEDEKRATPGLLSSIIVGTAGSQELGRGGTFSWLHGSETAFWGKNASRQMLGAINSIPDHDPNTMIALESTANGPSGYFYEQVMRAYRDPDNSAWELIFLPWMLFHKYRLRVKGKFEIRDEQEEALKANGVTKEQLNWRRWAIINKCDGSLNYFRQEYPSNVEEAFMYTGRSAFDREKLMVFIQRAPINPPRFIYEEGNLVEDKDGEIKIFHQPEPDTDYVAGGDVSEGINMASDGSDPDTDYSWFSIYRRDSMQQVLSWRQRIDPDLLGPIIAFLGEYYNNAWVNVEQNNHGIVPCNYLKKNYPLYRLYLTQRVDRVDDKETDYVGFKTTSATKAMMVAEGRKLIRDNDCWIYDKDMLAELLAFKQDNRGRYYGDGEHDDGVISFLLANIMRIYSYESPKRDSGQMVKIYSVEELRKHDPALIIGRPKRRNVELILGNHRVKNA